MQCMIGYHWRRIGSQYHISVEVQQQPAASQSSGVAGSGGGQVGDGGNDGSSGGGGVPFYNLGVNGMGSYPFAGHGEGDHMFTSSAGLHFK